VIECPQCGATNKPESRFCGECGQPLGVPKGVTCPMCETPHAPGITVCTECGARLIPEGVSPSEVPLQPRIPGEGADAPEEGEALDAAEGDRAEWEEVGDDVGREEQVNGETIPPWLRKLEVTPGEEIAGEGEDDLERGELPDWLEIPPEFEEMLGEEGAASEEEGAARADVPAWLEALRPEGVEDVVEVSGAGSPAEATGLLKGIRGALGIEPILAIARRAVPLEPGSPSSAAYERADLLSSVIREPARPGIEVSDRRGVEKLAASSVRWMTYLILAAAVVVPILLGSNWSESNMPTAAATQGMYDAIDGLPQGALVLVSLDYDPGVAGEMVPQARVVLNHLMRRGVRLLGVSLAPEGARLSRQVLEEVADDYGYRDGEDYLSLGYVVGVEAGPRSIVEGIRTPGWNDFVGDGEDLALIVEFAGDPQYLRLWLEQVQGPFGLPMVAGVSATVDPFARPYYRNQAQRQLLGLMTGLVGAAEYERISGEVGPALSSMDSQSVAHVALILLILVGNLAYFGNRLRGRSGG
jgi:hypothetical protein